MSAIQLKTLCRSAHFAASRERVFQAWTNAEELKQWWSPGRYTTTAADIDLRPGGHYRLTMRHPDGSIATLSGKYLEVVAPERIVMTWISVGGPRDDGHETLLTLEFLDRGGTTELKLTHERLPVASKDSYDSGWTAVIKDLQSHLSTDSKHPSLARSRT
jgi:uncharacterized protein YndB with AHSA1/START domain